jgi:hypothetical protein
MRWPRKIAVESFSAIIRSFHPARLGLFLRAGAKLSTDYRNQAMGWSSSVVGHWGSEITNMGVASTA